MKTLIGVVLVLILSVSSYSGISTERWFYVFNWATGMCYIYYYGGTGTPMLQNTSSWYYTVRNTAPTGGLKNSQEQ